MHENQRFSLQNGPAEVCILGVSDNYNKWHALPFNSYSIFWEALHFPLTTRSHGGSCWDYNARQGAEEAAPDTESPGDSEADATPLGAPGRGRWPGPASPAPPPLPVQASS